MGFWVWAKMEIGCGGVKSGGCGVRFALRCAEI